MSNRRTSRYDAGHTPGSPVAQAHAADHMAWFAEIPGTPTHEFKTEFPHVGVAVLCPAHTATSIRNDERNAPAGHIPRDQADPQLKQLRDQVNNDIDKGVSTEFVADLVVAGIVAGKTHIFPSPEWLDYWQDRVDRVRKQIDPVMTSESRW